MWWCWWGGRTQPNESGLPNWDVIGARLEKRGGRGGKFRHLSSLSGIQLLEETISKTKIWHQVCPGPGNTKSEGKQRGGREELNKREAVSPCAPAVSLPPLSYEIRLWNASAHASQKKVLIANVFLFKVTLSKVYQGFRRKNTFFCLAKLGLHLIHFFFTPAAKKECSATQPPTVVRKMEAQLEYIHIACTFLHVWHRFASSIAAY